MGIIAVAIGAAVGMEWYQRRCRRRKREWQIEDKAIRFGEEGYIEGGGADWEGEGTGKVLSHATFGRKSDVTTGRKTNRGEIAKLYQRRKRGKKVHLRGFFAGFPAFSKKVKKR